MRYEDEQQEINDLDGLIRRLTFAFVKTFEHGRDKGYKLEDMEYSNGLSIQTRHAFQTYLLLKEMLKDSKYPPEVIAFTAYYHDIGKAMLGNYDLYKIEEALPFFHHIIAAGYVDDDLRELWGGVHFDFKEDITNAIRLHSCRCLIIDELRLNEESWGKKQRDVIENLSSREDNQLLATIDDYRYKGFHYTPAEFDNNELARALSDADNCAQLLLFEPDQERGLAPSKLFGIIRAQLLFDGVNTVEEAYQRVGVRFKVLNLPGCGYDLFNDYAKEFIQQEEAYYHDVGRIILSPESQELFFSLEGFQGEARTRAVNQVMSNIEPIWMQYVLGNGKETEAEKSLLKQRLVDIREHLSRPLDIFERIRYDVPLSRTGGENLG